jgi:hypothetical protein
MLTRSDLRPYQDRAIAHFKRHSAAAGHIDMGLGKTVVELTTFADQLASFDARRMLVVAPLRVARKVWSDEVKRWSHLDGLEVSRIVGTEAERLAALRIPADIHTINRENLPWLEAQFFHNYRQTKQWPWDVVVLDESQSFKSPSGVWHRTIKRLRKFIPQLHELTGTCAPNGLMDLWGQFYLLDQGKRLGHTVTAFRDRWFTAKTMDGYVKWFPHDHAMAEITDAIADITISLRADDYLDLPPVAFNLVRVELPGELRAQYAKLERDSLLKLRNEKVITAVNAGACAGKLLQFASGAVYDENKQWHHLHDIKLDALEELLEGLPTPLLIGYSYVHELERIAQRLTKFCGKAKTWRKLDSDASFEEWKTGRIDYGVLHPASAGHGLNDIYMSGAENLVWLGVTTNLEWYLQLNARLTGGHRRTGRNVTIHHIVMDDTLDVEYVELIARKDATQETVKKLVAEKARSVS